MIIAGRLNGAGRLNDVLGEFSDATSYLQAELNRFAGVASFRPVAIDGKLGVDSNRAAILIAKWFMSMAAVSAASRYPSVRNVREAAVIAMLSAGAVPAWNADSVAYLYGLLAPSAQDLGLPAAQKIATPDVPPPVPPVTPPVIAKDDDATKAAAAGTFNPWWLVGSGLVVLTIGGLAYYLARKSNDSSLSPAI